MLFNQTAMVARVDQVLVIVVLASSARSAPTIFNKPKVPTLSELHRKQKIHANPPKGKRRARGEGAN